MSDELVIPERWAGWYANTSSFGVAPEILNRCIEELAHAEAALAEVEWAGKCCNVDGDPVCPECGSYKNLGRHAKDCMVAAALAEAKEGE